MPTRRTDRFLATALRLATKALAERASAEDLQDLALTILELDEAIVVDGESTPKRWTQRGVDRALAASRPRSRV
jgi:hypothetical protein